jgi:hypothetical protein
MLQIASDAIVGFATIKRYMALNDTNRAFQTEILARADNRRASAACPFVSVLAKIALSCDLAVSLEIPSISAASERGAPKPR